MEELVTVDEVGEDDDSIIEPDLPGLEKSASCPKGATEGEAAGEKKEEEEEEAEEEEETSAPRPAETSIQDGLSSVVGAPAEAAGTVDPEPVSSAGLQQVPTPPVLGDAPAEELKAKLEETCLEDKVTSDEAPGETPVCEEAEAAEARAAGEAAKMEVQPRSESPNRGLHLSFTEPEAPSPCLGREKAAGEHSIPLGNHGSLRSPSAEQFWRLDSSPVFSHLSYSPSFQTLVSVLKIKTRAHARA